MYLDIAVLCVLTFLAWQGAARGFIQSVLGPLAFVLATGIALIYYGLTHNILIALIIGLMGPFLLHWFLAFIVRSFGRVTGGDRSPSIVSSLLGGIITICWGMLFLLPIMIALALVPPTLPGFAPVHKYLVSTQTFTATQYLLVKLNVAPPSVPATAAADDSKDTPATSPLQSIADDEKVKKLMKDPAIVRLVEDNNFAGLMSNPKIMQLAHQLAQDPAFLKKALAAYTQMGTPPAPTKQPKN